MNHCKGLFRHVKADVVLLQESKIDDVSDALVHSIFYWRNFGGLPNFLRGPQVV